MNRAWLLLLALPVAAQTRLTLREALEQADKLNPAVQTARLRVLESKAQADQVRSRIQPQVNAGVTGTYATTNFQGIGLLFPGLPDRVGPYRTFNARPQATQTVIDLSLLSEMRAARERTKQVDLQQSVVRQETLLAVLQLYLQALQAESRVTAADARMKTAETVLGQTRDLESAGAASKLDIARAEQRLETERAVRINAERDREVIVASLLETIGMETSGDRVLLQAAEQTGTAPSADAAVSKALEQRSELRVAEAQARVAAQEKQAAVRGRLPKLQAFGDYGVLGRGPEQSLSTFQVGATVSVPLWTGRRIEAQIAEASARINIAEQELRRAKLQIARQVRQAEVELDAARQATTAAEKAAAAARTSLELAQLRFAAGLATNIDTVIAQGALAEAEDRAIQARYDHQLARARLARAQGDVLEFLE